MLVSDVPPLPRPVAVAPVSDEQTPAALAISQQLRRAGLAVDLGYAGKFAKRMKRANKINARVTVIVGEDELARDVVTVRDMDTGEQKEVALSSLTDDVARFY